MVDKSIRVLIVDDQTLVRRGTHALLNQFADIEVVGEASNGKEAIAQAETLRPDVILMDLMMPELDGIGAMREILARQTATRIIALTAFSTDDPLLPAVRAGALGYFLKDESPERLVQAIRQVAAGGAWLPPDIAQRVLKEMSQPSAARPSIDALTDRELQVLRLMASGKSNAEIADALAITEITVRTHVSHILEKLSCQNRVQATLYALREGIVSLDT